MSATECPVRASNQRTPGPTTRLLSMAPSNKKTKRRTFGRTSVAGLSKTFQGDGTPNTGTAVASAKAVQSVIPKAAKGIHAGIGSQGVSISYGSWPLFLANSGLTKAECSCCRTFHVKCCLSRFFHPKFFLTYSIF